MTRSFYKFWIIGAVLIAAVVFLGMGFFSAMALNSTGYGGNTSRTSLLLGSALGVAMYWSVACWAIALIRSRPVYSVGLVAAGIALAFGYPAYDANSYANQRAQIATHSIEGDKQILRAKRPCCFGG